jgi:amino acid adenylation domain-containing protein
MGRHLRRLLESAVAHPEAGIGDIELMDDAERHEVLVTWNATAASFPPARTVVELIERQAASRPDAIALAFGGAQLTYRELNGRGNQLAHWLREHGAGVETLVGLCVERSVEMVVGILGILKAGAAYVPFDPEYPAQRLAYMLADANPPLLLTQERLAPALPAVGARLFCLDRDWGDVEGFGRDDLPTGASPENLAYCIYTSGSTGAPKGVVNTHAGLLNRLQWMQSAYRIDASDRVLQKTPFSFDVSVWEFLWPIMSGAVLVVAAPGVHKDPAQLRATIDRFGVTVLHFVPSMLQAFIAAGELSGCPSVRQVMCSGEVLSYELQEQFRRQHRARLHNLYGPTEASIDVSFWECRDDDRRIVPIGHPIANTALHVLDARMKPVPIGVAGELYIGGVGLARGYLNRPELTAERFVPDPYGAPGEKLYRTGDLARRRADGTIEFLGRRDQQVKVRGFRIELGEIEAALALHGAVREVVVMAREDEPGDKRLVAYHVATRGVAASELRGFLKEKLPEYMVPAAFEQLEALPLTPNGKVDRKALPAPQSGRSGLEVAFVAPRTPAEEALARIWSEVLGIAGVGVEDNFFELGGHSLLATQVVSRVRRALDVELPLRALFERPTIAALAELAQLLGSGPAGGASAVARVSREFPLPLSFAQEDFWFRSKTLRDASSNVPLAVRLEGEIDLTRLDRVATMLLGRHEGLRARFVELDGVPRQIVREPWVFCIPLVDVSSVPDAEREKEAARVLRAFAADPIRADSDVLFRLLLVRLGTRQHVLAATVHHMVVDAASLDVLRREFADLYASPECEAALPTLHLQYADFAAWEREHLGEEERGRRLSYWKARLAAPYPVLRLPTDRPRPPVRAYTAVTHAVRWGPDLARAVNGSARALRVTPFTVLLAAYQALLHRYTRQDDVLVGVPMSNRSHEGAEGVVGLFVHPAVIRCRFREDATGRQIVRAVADELAGAYAHPAPNRELLAAVAADPARGYSQIYQTYFAYQSLPECAPGQNGLRTSPWNSFAMDLGVSIFHGASSLLVTMDYASELFTSAHIAAMADDFRGAIELVTWQPDAPLTDISVSASTPVPA